MPLDASERDEIHRYCTKDLPGDMHWHISQFSFITDSDLQQRLGRAYYSARYIAKLMEAMRAQGDELHAFVKYQIIQYASIYEAVVSHLLWTHYKDHIEVKKLTTHKSYKPVSALGHAAEMTFDGEKIFTCVYRDTKTDRNSIPFKDRVDCAIRIGFVSPSFSEDIKQLYALRNLAHIESEAEKNIEVEIEDAKNGYWRMKPFLEGVVEALKSSNA